MNTKAQENLVLNSSFDIVSPNYYCIYPGGVYFYLQNSVPPWRNGFVDTIPQYDGGTVNKPFNKVCKSPQGISEIPFYLGSAGYQDTHSGEGFIELFNTSYYCFTHNDSCSYDSLVLQSEYIRSSLSSSLLSGKKYYSGFHVNYPNYLSFICNNVGMAVTADTFPQYYHAKYDTIGNIYKRLIQYVPEVNNPSGRSLYDTLNWVMIADTVTALGGEQYVTLGQFDDGNPLDTMHNGFYGYNPPEGIQHDYDPRSAFFFDDVFVIPLDSLSNTWYGLQDNIIADSVVCPIGYARLSVRGDLPLVRYKWYNPQGQVTDTTNYSIFITGTSGWYKLWRKNPAGTERWDSVYLYVKPNCITGEQELPNVKVNGVIVYPNPSNNYIKIHGNINQGASIEISIVDLIGKVVLTKELKSTNNQLSEEIKTNDLPNGTYFVHLKQDDVPIKVIKFEVLH